MDGKELERYLRQFKQAGSPPEVDKRILDLAARLHEESRFHRAVRNSIRSMISFMLGLFGLRFISVLPSILTGENEESISKFRDAIRDNIGPIMSWVLSAFGLRFISVLVAILTKRDDENVEIGISLFGKEVIVWTRA